MKPDFSYRPFLLGAVYILAACRSVPADTPTPASAGTTISPTTTPAISTEPPLEPTATPTSPPVEDGLIVALAVEGDLRLWHEATGQTKTLIDDGDVDSVFISDDGQVIAFTRRRLDENQCLQTALWAVDRNGGNSRELLSFEDLGALLGDTDCEYPFATFARIEWLPRTHRLLYSVVWDAPHAPIQGLFLADADALSSTTLVSVEFSQHFVSSPDGQQIALMSTSGLSFIDADGSNWSQDVATYPVSGIPIPGLANGVWTLDGRAFLLAAPAAEGMAITLVPVDGSVPQVLAEITGTNRDSITFSPDGNYVGFYQDGPSWSILPLAPAPGLLAIPARSDFGTQANLHWSPANVPYVFKEGNLYVLCPDATNSSESCDSINPGYVAFNAIQWIDGERFLFQTRDPAVLFLGWLDHRTAAIVAWPLEAWVTPQSFSAVFIEPIAVGADLAEFAEPGVSASAIAISPDGAWLAAVNPDSGTVSLVSLPGLEPIREVQVGRDPRNLVFGPDSKSLYVPNFGGNSVAVVDVERGMQVSEFPVGPMPYAAIVQAGVLYVTEQSLGAVSAYDANTGEKLSALELEPFPAGLAYDPNSGRLYVTHLYSGLVSRIDLAGFTVEAVLSTGGDTNLTQFLLLDLRSRRAYLPQTRSNVTNLALGFDSTVFPLVNVLDLDSLEIVREERVSLDVGPRSVNMPFAVALDEARGVLLVANAGSNDVSVIDLESDQQLARIEVGANPRGIVFDPRSSRAFVNNVLDGTLSVIDVQSLQVVQTISVTEIPLDPQILLGKQLFHAARVPDLTTDRWISCAVCHFDGGIDGRTWLGFPDGPRNTPALFGVGLTSPFHWSGDLDELQDVELTVRNIQAGIGLIAGDAFDSLGPSHAGLSAELDALAAFMASLEVPASPYVFPQGELDRGEAVFDELGCPRCHPAPLYTDRLLHDVGTGDPALEHNSHGRGTQFDTPSLIGLWATAPYFHDGSAATLEEALAAGVEHNVIEKIDEADLQALISFLLGLPYE